MIYVCVTSLCNKSVWQMLCIRLSAEVLSGSVWPIYFSFSRVLSSELCLKIWFTWRVTWREESVWQMLWMRPCAGFVLSGSVWPIYFPFSRFHNLHSSWHSVWRFDLCLWRFFVLCDLRLCTNVMNASLVITFECPVLGRVVDKWSRITSSSGYPSLRQPLVCLRRGCLMPLIAPSLDEVFRGCFAVDFSPFLPFRWLVLLFSFFICKPRPVTTLITFSSQFRYRFILSDGAIGKGKGLALQSLSLHLP